MKTAVAVLIVCFASIAPMASAQEKMEAFMTSTTPEERAQMQTDHMKQTLTLTENQLPQVQEINLKYARKMQDAYNGGGSRLQKLKRVKGVSQEKDKELKRVLTSTQYATYESNKEEMKEKMRERAKERMKTN